MWYQAGGDAAVLTLWGGAILKLRIIEVSQTSGTAPTIRLQNKKINQPMSITLTFLPNKSSQALSEQQQIETVKNIATQYVDSSIEQKTSLRRLITPIGDALLANFNDVSRRRKGAETEAKQQYVYDRTTQCLSRIDEENLKSESLQPIWQGAV